jgi:uncharacterized protein YjbI with pentapeptide repeats
MFRELSEGRSIRRPAVERDELRPQPADFDGTFDVEFALVDSGDQAGELAELAEVIGDGSVAHSVLRRVDLSGARLGPLRLIDSVLEDVELSNASIQRVTANRVELTRCRAIGLRLSVEQASDLYVEECRIDFATIRIVKIKKIAAFVGCSFRETTIAGDLSNAIFLDCDFTDTEFAATNANDCDLRASRLTGARGLRTLRGALITQEQAISVADRLATEIGLVVRD